VKLVPLVLVCLCAGAQAQLGIAPSGGVQPVVPPPPIQQPVGVSQENPFQGSVLSNESFPATFSLSLQDAIQRGLKQNLGLIIGDLNTRLAQAEQRRANSALLPDISGRVSDTVEQINLKALGFSFSFPGFNIPSIIGPFNVFDARANLTQSVWNLQRKYSARAAKENLTSAQLSYRDNRDLVTLLVASGYLQVIADGARVDEVRSEVETAQALYNRAADLLRNGLMPAIDALRAQVELQSEQTLLRAHENDLAKDKLALARLIGLPLGQQFILSDQIPYKALEPLDQQEAIEQALRSRYDYQSLQSQIRAAELNKRAAQAERYPSLDANGDFGDIGNYPNNLHPTFSAGGAVTFSIFNGGRIRSDIEQADTELQQRRAQLADLRAQIEYQVRSSFLDLQTAADQIEVARSSLELARQTLTQAQDRFSAGVADNIEVVQAQNSVALASETYIDSVYAHNLAKVSLARSLGMADQHVQEFLGGR